MRSLGGILGIYGKMIWTHLTNILGDHILTSGSNAGFDSIGTSFGPQDFHKIKGLSAINTNILAFISRS